MMPLHGETIGGAGGDLVIVEIQHNNLLNLHVCVLYVPILVGKDGSHPTDLSHDQGNHIRPIPSLLSCDSLGGITQASVM